MPSDNSLTNILPARRDPILGLVMIMPKNISTLEQLDVLHGSSTVHFLHHKGFLTGLYGDNPTTCCDIDATRHQDM